MEPGKKFSTIDEYHAAFPDEVREKLDVFRKTITEVIPHGKELISYNIPAFRVNKIVVFYASHKKHISLYPAPNGKEWEKEFEPYKTSGKGTIQFSYDAPIPLDLIRKIVKHLADRDASSTK